MVSSSKANINYKLYTYGFPADENRANIADGTVVALDGSGKIRRGGGYTMFRNISDTVNYQQLMPSLKIQMSGSTAIAVYEGWVYFYYINGDRKILKSQNRELPKAGDKTMVPSYLIKMSDHYFIIIGSAYAIPFFFEGTWKSDTDIQFDFVTGPAVRIHPDTAKFPQVDNLSETDLAYIYEETAPTFKLMAAIGHMTIAADKKPSLTVSTAETIQPDGIFGFHRVVGYRSNLFMVACNGELRTQLGVVPGDANSNAIRVRLVEVLQDDKMKIGDWVIRDYSDNLSWFASDNLNDNNGIIAYYSSLRGGAVIAMAVQVRQDTDGLLYPVFGASMVVESGGASVEGSYQRIVLRILNSSQFGVCFPDRSAGGSIVYMMGELSPNGDLNRIGANMMISRQGGNDEDSFYFDLAAWTTNRAVIIESFKYNDQPVALVNIGENVATPLGIAVSMPGKSYEVQTSGVYTFKNKKLERGYTYYTDAKGEIFRGDYYGYDYSEFGVFYITPRNAKRILSVANQIGVAVSETELLIRQR